MLPLTRHQYSIHCESSRVAHGTDRLNGDGCSQIIRDTPKGVQSGYNETHDLQGFCSFAKENFTLTSRGQHMSDEVNSTVFCLYLGVSYQNIYCTFKWIFTYCVFTIPFYCNFGVLLKVSKVPLWKSTYEMYRTISHLSGLPDCTSVVINLIVTTFLGQAKRFHLAAIQLVLDPHEQFRSHRKNFGHRYALYNLCFEEWQFRVSFCTDRLYVFAVYFYFCFHLSLKTFSESFQCSFEIIFYWRISWKSNLEFSPKSF